MSREEIKWMLQEMGLADDLSEQEIDRLEKCIGELAATVIKYGAAGIMSYGMLGAKMSSNMEAEQ